jgi:hypothetical protein
MEAASNRGLESSVGKYIAIHDDDDTWAPEFLDLTSGILEADDDAVGVAVATEVVVERVADGHVEQVETWMFTPPADLVTVFDLLLSNRVVPIGLLVRRTAVDAIGGYDESLPVVGDWDFNLRLAMRGPIRYLPRRLAFWHQRPSTDGALSNSIYNDSELHFRYDRVVRERALTADLGSGGLGQLLYLSKFITERVTEAEERIAARIDAAEERRTAEWRADLAALEVRIDARVHEHVQYHSPAALAQRTLRRLVTPRRKR